MITLVYPTFKVLESPMQPFGILYIAALLRKENFDVRIVDTSTFENFSLFEKWLKENRPDIVGITVTTWLLDNTLRCAEIAKMIIPGVKVIVGGPHPTIAPRRMLEDSNIDIVVYGEGEYTALDVCTALQNGSSLREIKGICYRDNGEIIENSPRPFIQDLDQLPPPARDLLDMDIYLKQRPVIPDLYPTGAIIASRGCNYNCSFCQPALRKLFGGGIRYRKYSSVADEIYFLIDRYKVSGFRLVDDEPTIDKQWMLNFCEELIARNIRIKWSCNSRVNTVDEEVLKAMKEAGCFYIIFGVESGSQQILNSLRKGIKIEKIKETFRLCNKLGITTRANFMAGSPGETQQSISDSLNLIHQIKPDLVIVGITTPIPGTDLYTEVKERGLLYSDKEQNLERYTTSIKLENFSAEQTYRLVKLIFKQYFKEVLNYCINPVMLYKKRHFFKSIFLYFYNILKKNPRLFLRTAWYWLNYRKIRFKN